MVIMKLFKKLLRDLKESKGQFIAITIVIIIGALCFTGFSTMTSVFKDYIDDYYKKYNLADIWSYYYQISSDDINKIENIDGVNSAEGRYSLDFKYKVDDEDTTIRLHSYSEDSKINIPYIVEGDYPKSTHDVVLDNNYAQKHNIKVGDKITLNYENKKNIDLTVTGLIEDVEYVEKIINSYDSIPDHSKYGIGYFNEDIVTEIAGKKMPYTDVLVDTTDKADTGKIIDKIEEETKNSSYLYSIDRSKQISYAAFNGEIEQFGSISALFPVLFYGIAAIIIFITMTRLVDHQRNQIGIMKALGVKKSKIMIHYIEYPIIITLVGSLFGSIIGSILVPKYMILMYEGTYTLPGIGIRLYTEKILLSVVIAIIFGVLASYFSCRKTLKESASSAMRPLAPKAGKKLLIERCKKIWAGLSYSNKIVMRNTFSNKKRAILSSIGIIGSISLIITAFGMKDSMDKVLDTQYDKIYNYDFKVSYTDNKVSAEELDLPENITYKEVMETSYEVKNDNEVLNGSIVCIDDNKDYISILDLDEKDINVSDDGVIISKYLSEKFNLKKGDTIKIKLTGPDYKGASFNAKIINVSTQYMTQDIYCTQNLLKENNIDTKSTALLVKLTNNNSYKKVLDSFKNQSKVDNVVSTKESKADLVEYCAAMNSLVALLIVFALLLSFAVIYNISSINIMERERVIATLKVLGNRRNKINGLILKENMIITVIAVILGTPIGLLLLKFILLSAETDTFSYPLVISVRTIILPIILTFLFTFVSSLALRRKIKKVDMVEALKTLE